MNCDRSTILHCSLGRKIGHLLKGPDVFRPAIGVAAVVHSVHPNVDIPRTRDLGQRECVGKKDRVARGDVGDGYFGFGDAPFFDPVAWYGDICCERGSAKGPKIDFHDLVSRYSK